MNYIPFEGTFARCEPVILNIYNYIYKYIEVFLGVSMFVLDTLLLSKLHS